MSEEVAEKVGSLRYMRKARKAKDGYDGFMYSHHWKTGNQELIFRSEDDAKKFARIEKLEYHA